MLTAFFKEKQYITRLQFERLFLITTSTARNRLINLVAAGKLIKEGSNHAPFYMPAKGHYGK